VGGSNNHALLFSAHSKLPVAWCPEKLLKFDMPFIDMKPSIYLGKYVEFTGFAEKICNWLLK